MTDAPFRILLVEDNAADARLLEENLADAASGRFEIARAERLADALHRLDAEPFDALLLDLSLPDSHGLETVERVRAAASGLPIIVLTSLDDEVLGAQAVRLGAQDYLVKGQADGRLLTRALRYAVERQRIEEELRGLTEFLEERVKERTAMAEKRAAQLQAMALELARAEQRERRRLAQVLHDHLQQLLAVARMRVGLLADETRSRKLRAALEEVDGLLDESIAASRSLTVELSPPVLYDAGLAPALEWLATQVQEKHGLAVAVEADRGAEPASEDTKAFLFHAARELLFNVVKHARVGRASVRLSSCGGEVALEVRDAGAGFDPAELGPGGDRVSGFGLFSIRERLEALGGRIAIESAPGQGACFTLFAPRRFAAVGELPPAEAAQAAPGGPAPARKAGHRTRVLVADDHAIVREGLVGLFERHDDLEVVGQAEDGQAAVEMAHALRPDVVVMDVSMPRLNGIEATRHITAALPGVRVIGLSMHEEADIAAQMREAGATCYLVKDGPSAALLAAIRGV